MDKSEQPRHRLLHRREKFCKSTYSSNATVTVSVTGSLAFVQSRKTEFSPPSPSLWKISYKNKLTLHGAWRISVIEKGLTRATHTWCKLQEEAPSWECHLKLRSHRRAGSNGHSQEFCVTVATRRQQTHKGPTWCKRLTAANWSDFLLPPNHDFFLPRTT